MIFLFYGFLRTNLHTMTNISLGIRDFIFCSTVAHVMSPPRFPNSSIKARLFMQKLVLNYMSDVLEKLLTSKSLVQKRERAATVAALTTLADGNAAIYMQALDRRPACCSNGSHLCVGTARVSIATCSGARRQGYRHDSHLRMGIASAGTGNVYGC